MPLHIEQHITLAPHTTLGVGGPARWFATAHTEADVQAAHAFAKERGISLFVMGGGSNLLVSDDGFPGLVLRIAIAGIEIVLQNRGGSVHVTAGAGENWDALVQFTVERDFAGMECLAGIPGTVGGTPVQNVGAYGQEVAQTLVSAHAFDTVAEAFVELEHEQFGFAYRTSLLNTSERGRYILTSVTFALRPAGQPNLSYADLKRTFPPGTRPALMEVADSVRAIRRQKGMILDAGDPDSRSAGSFFRNPVVPLRCLRQIGDILHLGEGDVPHWPAGDGTVKLPAAWLLEKAGFVRGYTLGNAGISSKHTLALINRSGATSQDIADLRDQVRTEVYRRFGVHLEQEPVCVGEPALVTVPHKS